MKRAVLFFFLLFLVSANNFAQSAPVEALRNFWSMALSNNYDSAQIFVFSTSQTKEFKYQQVKDSFRIIFDNKLQLPELDTSQIFPETAYFDFQIESKEKF